HDARLNQHLLESRLLLIGSYDLIVQDVEALSLLLDAPALVAMDKQSPAIPGYRVALSRILAEKTAVVEEYKSAHAILRNSLDYFPIAACELAEVLRRDCPEHAIREPLHDLMEQVLLHYHRTDSAGEGHMETSLTHLETCLGTAGRFSQGLEQVL